MSHSTATSFFLSLLSCFIRTYIYPIQWNTIGHGCIGWATLSELLFFFLDARFLFIVQQHIVGVPLSRLPFDWGSRGFRVCFLALFWVHCELCVHERGRKILMKIFFFFPLLMQDVLSCLGDFWLGVVNFYLTCRDRSFGISSRLRYCRVILIDWFSSINVTMVWINKVPIQRLIINDPNFWPLVLYN